MNIQLSALFYSVLTGLLFGAWPLISRKSGLSPIWTSATVTVGTALVIFLSIMTNNEQPPIKSLSIGAIAGIVAGLGLLTYSTLIGRSGEWDMSVTIPISLVITPMVIIAGGYLFYNDPLTFNKGAGGVLGIIAIYLMCK